MVYERLLEKLQVKDTVSQVMLQYLGKVFGEARIMADNGNYDCDLESCRMEYGKKYVVYVQGNLILGICSQEEQKQTEGKDSEKAEKRGDRTGDGSHRSDHSSGYDPGVTDTGSEAECLSGRRLDQM